MNYRSLLSGLRYCGLVRSAKRKYHVAESAKYYVLFSPGKRANGNFTVVASKGVDYLAKRMGGKRSVTTAEAFDACKRSRFLAERFAILNAMYVLVATGRARISKIADRVLYFDIRKHAG